MNYQRKHIFERHNQQIAILVKAVFLKNYLKFIESARDTPAFRRGEGVRLVLSGRYNYDGIPEGRERFK